MAEHTKVEWCTHTWNPWWGSAKVSAACRSCYAADIAKRWGHDVWGVNAPRRILSPSNWREPLTWDRRAVRTGECPRVFCASMADVFEDRRDLDQPRAWLWELIERTPNLTWLLLTKRPGNISWLVPQSWWRDGFPANVWMGTTVESQDHAWDRIGNLELVPSVVHFVSCEPLLGPVELPPYSVDWVIAGEERGHGARPSDRNWFRQLRDQCVAEGAAFFLKQFVEAKGLKKISLPELDGQQWAQVPEVQQ